MNKENLQALLNNIYTDLLMLKEGEWTPDESSCEDSIKTIEDIAIELDIEITDTRV